MLIKATIDRLEDEKAVLKTSKGESIIWPKNSLPQSIQEGTVLRIALTTDKQSETADQELAKDILNEILHNPQE